MIGKTTIAALIVAARIPAGAAIAPERRAEAEKAASEIVAKMTPEERLAELMMGAPGVPRLGVKPHHWWNEALHGYARAGLATVFPQSMAAAASFDTELMERIGGIVATEARAKYNIFQKKGDYGIYCGLTVWSPNVNMFRDPRWGRGQETYGEDPFLSGEMGGAYVRGLQGDNPKYLKTAACAKHFAVHSGPEKLRHAFSANVSLRDMNEYYFPAFRKLVMSDKVESVMGAYSAINGVPCCANKWLLTDILRGEWGFAGHIVSDVGAVNDIFSGHKFAESNAAASKAAMAAGLDLCSEGTYSSLAADVAAGAVSAADLAAALRRLYTTRALLGHFDAPGSTPWDSLGADDIATEENRAAALKMAEESLVLVHNNGALPVDRGKSVGIGVMGPRAKDEAVLLGNYCGYTDRPSSVLAGFAGVAGPGLKVTTDPDIWGPDVFVVCLGISADEEGEEAGSINNADGDRTSYEIPEHQLAALRRYRSLSSTRKIVSVVFGCSPFNLAPVVELSDAVIVAWYPGERGGEAIARTVFGLNNPAGRLPITYPKSYSDLPDFKDYTLAGRTYLYSEKDPLYPFGYGLSYTTFSYANAEASWSSDGKCAVRVDVTNTGALAGDEVVQVYVRAPEKSADRRKHHLAGFRRVSIAPGETKKVTVNLTKDGFTVYDKDGRPFLPTEASTVFVGGGQPGFAQTLSVDVKTILGK